MSVFGCHSCGVDITKYPDYMSSPCATCKLAVEYTNTKRAAMFDSCGTKENAEQEEDAAFARIDEELEHAGDDPQEQKQENQLLTPEALKTLSKSIEEQMMITLSGLIVRLLKLAKTSPVMFELVLKKMQFPYMSYSELGSSMQDSFSKQNVLYHLKHAVTLFPELSSALLTDTRFSGGRYALQTIANRLRQDEAKKRIRGILYGDLEEEYQTKQLEELNALLHAPFMLSDEAINFNPYINDEK